MNNEKKLGFAKYHIRQSVGLCATGLALGAIGMIPILGWIINIVGIFVLLYMWIMALMNTINEKEKPARAKVLITKPIKNLKIKGSFHLDKGYYYFRNVNDRILFGGGRHLDFLAEQTFNLAQTEIIQNKLKILLETTLLQDTPFEIEHRWSGIMGVGNQKKAIVKQLSNHVYCGVRLGGMGIAIGSSIGQELSNLIE